MQRLRLEFGRGNDLKYVSHLNVLYSWERSFRRANIPLAYSQGFTPHPQISVAVPLAIGMTSEAELMDVRLTGWLPPQSVTMMLRAQIANGFQLYNTWMVGLSIPSLQSVVSFAEYSVKFSSQYEQKDVENAIHTLLQKKELQWHHSRGEKTHYYDLRALIDDIWIESHEKTSYILGMRLCCGDTGNGRPEQIISALGFNVYPESIHRRKIILQ
jgi:radical SAM-linked protein